MDHPDRIAAVVHRRTQAVDAIRRFFAERGVTEVHTPLITACGVTDVHIESLGLADGRWLRTSPEYAHKRLLAAGLGDLYELGPVFRAGESGRRHRVEFSLLEWYRIGWTWEALAGEAVELVRHVLSDHRWQVEFVTWQDAVRRATGLEVDPENPDSVRAATADAPDGLGLSESLDWLFACRVQPALDRDTLTVVFDYPACQAALARIRPDDRAWAERFELFAGGLELANGYRELTDPVEQRRRFEADNRRRLSLGRPAMPIDEALLDALAAGLPDCSGVALGFERLLMAGRPEQPIDAVSLGSGG
jgi:lysyl-tRNA synthetase class 2